MLKTKKAFTLTELLVVVLIIGILAAVALPMYNKAIIRSRLMSLLIHSKAIRTSLAMYRLENSEKPTKLADLDVFTSFPADNKACLGEDCFTLSGTYYMRTTRKLPGYYTWICDIHLSNVNAFCYVYDTKGAALAASIGMTPTAASVCSDARSGQCVYSLPPL